MTFRRNWVNGVFPTLAVSGVIFFWFIYACTYLILKNRPDTVLLSGYLSLIGETGLDIFLVGVTLRLWYRTKCPNNKKLFLIFFLAFISAVFADGIYNIVLNLYEFPYVNPIIIFMFELPFSLFLFFQALAWTYILYINRENTLKFNRTLYIPYLIVSTLMFAMFMFGLKWQIQYFSLKGIFQSIDTVLEVIGFSMATICLARAQTFLIRFTSIGYFLIISSDFIIRYHVVSGMVPYLSSLESTWILGLTLMSLGFFLIKNSNDKLFRLSSINSLQSQIGIWLLVLWLISVFMFAGTYYFFSPDTELYLNHFTKNFLSILVPFSVLAIISSSYISIKISSPLSRLESKINQFLLTEITPEEITNLNDYGYIYEFKVLEKFVFDAFSLYQRKYFTEMSFAKLAAQVTHDIRSPLAAINTVLSDVTAVPENKRIMIRNAANRINDIANNLLLKSKNDFFNIQDSNSENSDSAELIFVVLDNIVAEKRYEHYKTNVNINLNGTECSYNCFSRIHLSSFKRVLSNLINNSIEALNSNGSIEITLNCNATHVEIIIEDNGCGIPSEILPKVTEQGFSFNKMNGAGLGLSYAKQYLEQINGKMHIHSEKKIGTRITIELIRAEHPSWFCDTINISQDSSIVVLDDDPSIHNVWHDRFLTINNSKITHCYKASELIQYKIESEKPILYLIDYELITDVKNGLDVIEKLQINDKAILVTSCFEDLAIRRRCENMGVKIIPKPYVPYIKVIQTPYIEHRPSLVFIDDDEMIRSTWLFAAEEAGITISTYSSFDEFLNEISNYNKDTAIYIDSDLGNNIKGEICAKHLFDEGFFEIHLATGFPKEMFCHMPWIKAIVGKEPPFLVTQRILDEQR